MSMTVLRVGGAALALTVSLLGAALAEPPGSAPKRPGPAAKSAPAKPTQLSGPSGEGYRTAALPTWVQEAPPAPAWTPPAGGKARRDELVDLQLRLAGPATQSFIRLRQVALDASTLRSVSEPQLNFNPSYQKVVLHHATVRRDGVVQDRLRQARIEPLRREQGLEQRMLTGMRTLLLVLPDVRVGDAVELAYTIEGENPIFEDQYANTVDLAGDAALDLLQLRIDAPTSQTLHFKPIGQLASAGMLPQRSELAGRQHWLLRRQHVAPVVEEQGVPPWVKQYPALQISSWRDWGELDAWAQRLFKPTEPDAALGELAQRLRAEHADPTERVAAALRFVQDEVRYFSLSLGENSHRPKPATQTLAERLGDCKDKVVLLNSLLALLDQPAHPVLVSLRRQRGLRDYLPGHDQLDHVVSRARIDGRDWILDPTLSGQGLALPTRGHLNYAVGLPVDGSAALLELPAAPEPTAAVTWRQRWDLSQVDAAPRLEVELETRGLPAESLRATLQTQGREAWQEGLAGEYLRSRPGLRLLGAVQIDDDRQANRLRALLHFEHPNPAKYERGLLRIELPLSELHGLLQAPPEAKRQFPFLMALPGGTEHHLEVLAPVDVPQRLPAPFSLQGPGLAFNQRFQAEARRVRVETRIERRGDAVQPGELDTLRERLQRMHGQLGAKLGMPLFDASRLRPEFEAADRRLQGLRAGTPDQLDEMLREQEIRRVLAGAALQTLGARNPMAVGVLEERGVALNLLGEHDAALADAEAALRLDPGSRDALDVKAVALLSMGRAEQALPVFEQLLARGSDDNGAQGWLAVAHHHLGNLQAAEDAARAQVDRTQGEAREFALLWLYLTAERHRGAGAAEMQQRLAAPATGSDDTAWPVPIRRFLLGQLSQGELLELARRDERQRRLRLAEAQYFVGAQLVARGQAAQARPWFERTLATRALPYREHTLARLALGR